MTQKNTDLHRDTLAVREAVERSQYGENSEALYLTSGYVQPSAESAARRFGQVELIAAVLVGFKNGLTNFSAGTKLRLFQI